MPEWTPKQKEAIELRGRNLLVAAAAGSGKTAVLVERIIRQVTCEDVDVDKLLVMTFTDAAAREMRQRVEAALEKALEAADDRARAAKIERQLVLLSGASISTMHKFCMGVLQRHFEAIDLDPQFRLGGSQELALLRQDVLEELFEQQYEEGAAAFLQLATDYGSDRGDELLYALVERLYDFSLAQPFPDEWLKKQAAAFDIAPDAHLSDTIWYTVVREEIRLRLRSLADEAAALVEDAEAEGLAPYAETFQNDAALLHALQQAEEAGEWAALYDAFSTASFSKLKSVRGADKAITEPLKARRDELKKMLAKLTEKYFYAPEDELVASLRHAAPDVRELVDLTIAFHAAYQAAKKEKGLADFSDLEHFVLAILVDHAAHAADPDAPLAPSPVALALREKYHEVMVDEYQDTNGVQEAIVNLVARQAPPNLFVVGDVKQSIYRFRLANPELFNAKYETYPQHPETCARVDLSQNFRSRPEVLAAINYIFAQVMVKKTMELAYDDAAALHPGPDYAPCEGEMLAGPQELVLLCKDDGDADAAGGTANDGTDGDGDEEDRTAIAHEAQYIADRIHAFFAAGTQVYHKDDGKYHPIEYRDIVILMRSVAGKAEDVLKVLQQNDIPAYASSDAGYFEAREVRLMLSLLSILDNARQDIPLAAVLLSPIGGFTIAEMAAVRLAAPDGDIFTALLTAANPDKDIDATVQQKAAAFLARLTHWRDLARELGVPELIWQLYRETGYYDYVGGLTGGLLKQANLRMLATRAAEYEATNFRGLFRFLHFVARMRAMDTDLAAARTLGESENVVRIMTIHGSKGLEFPLVFVANLGGKFNLRDSTEELLLHRDYGLGPYAVDAPDAVRYATFARQAVATRIVMESKAEELRLLYVALTRARERLILVGTAGKEEKLTARVQRWGRYAQRTAAALPEDVPLAADSFLDWLLMALVHHAAARDLRAEAGLPLQTPTFLDWHESADWEISVLQTSELSHEKKTAAEEHDILAAVRQGKKLEESTQKDAVEALLGWSYDVHGLADVPSKLSVSELKRRFAEQEAAEDGTALLLKTEQSEPWKRPRFIQETTRMTGAEYGSLMHSVLQYVDLAGELTPAGIREQIAQMVTRELLTKDEAAHVDARAVTSFYASPLGQRLRHATRLWRELPFSRLLPAQRFYETAEEGETLLIQGVIDLLFEEADGTLVLVDYKTDSDTRPEKIKNRYALQLDLYSEAVSAVLGRPIRERYLYLLHDGKTMKM